MGIRYLTPVVSVFRCLSNSSAVGNLGEAGEEVGGGEGCGERGGGETAREGVEGVKPPAPFGA